MLRPAHLRWALVILLATAAAFAQSKIGAADEQAPLLRLERQWLDAIQQRDIKFLDHLLDENFVDTAADGHLRNKQDALSSPIAQNVESEKLQDLHVRMHGDTAVVTGVNVVTGKANSYVATVRFTDVFHKVDGDWKAIAAQENVSVAHP